VARFLQQEAEVRTKRLPAMAHIPIPFRSKLVLCFGAFCILLVAIGVGFFVSLRSIEILHAQEIGGQNAASATAARLREIKFLGSLAHGFSVAFAFAIGFWVVRTVRSLRKAKAVLHTRVSEFEHAEQALREGQARYRTLVEHSPDAIMVVCDERIVFLNPAALEMFGATDPEQMLGQRWEVTVHPDERAEVAVRTELILAGKQPPQAERRFLRLDGSTVYADSRVVAFLYEGKRAVQVIARDNMERKIAQEKLHAQEKQYRLLFEDNPSPMWVYDIDSLGILAVNHAAISTYGYSREEFLAGTLRNFHLPEDMPVVEKAVASEAGSSRYGIESRHRKKNGEVINVAVYSRPTIFDNKKARIALAIDLTERAAAESKVRESETNLALAQRVAGMGSWEYRPDKKNKNERFRWSQETYRLFGRTPEDFRPSLRAFLAAVHPEDRAYAAIRLRAFAASNGSLHADFRIIRPDGSERIVHAAAEKIRMPQNGELVKIIGTVLDITQLRAVEKQLREAEQKYRAIFENASEGIFQSTPGGRFLAINPAAARIFGFASPEEMIAERSDISRQSYVQPSRRDDFIRAIEERGVVNGFECEVYRKDGTKIWLHENARKVADEKGRTQFYEGTLQDITKRKQIEEALQRQQTELRTLFDLIPAMVWFKDTQNRILRVNHAAAQASGQSIEEIEGKSAPAIYPRDFAQFVIDDAAVIESGVPRLGATEKIVRADGREIWIQMDKVPYRDKEGNVIGIVVLAQDVTERKAASERMAEQAALLDQAHDAILVRDLEGHILFWSRGAERLYGYTREEALGRKNPDLLYGSDSADYERGNAVTMQKGEWIGELRQLVKDGHAVTVEAHWTLTHDDEGKPKSILAINNDITEQKKFQEQFFRAQRLESIGTLASGVAHDLNNILSPIMMATSVLREKIDPGERDKFLDIVEGSARRGAEIIKQVLTFARGADGDRVLLQPIYLLEEVSKIASQTFPKSIAFRTSYDETVQSIEADPTQLHQVLLNLCINARDAMPNGGQLRLSAENFEVTDNYARMTPGATPGPHVMIEVTDNGNGIPENILPKIFDPFFTTKGIGKGTGLGLSTVAGIVKSHGGFINVTSEPGRTNFKVFLPSKKSAGGYNSIQPDKMIPLGQGQTILIVDDEEIIRQVAQMILESNGYQVLVAEDGPSALALLAQRMSDIAAVITDLAMPAMDGVMLVRTMRRIAPGLKVIISTGRDHDPQGAEMIALDIDGYLTKPYTTRSLLLKLSHVLNGGIQNAA
jgi:hypothetical protein